MSQKYEDKIYVLLIPDKVKYKVWSYDFSTNVFEIKKIIEIDLVVPNKSVEVLIPYMQESKSLVQSLLAEMYSPVIRLFKVSAVAQQLNTKSTTAKKLIQELAKTPNLMLQSLLTHSDVCSVEKLINTYWDDFCTDNNKKPVTVKHV
jgi:hypothetical protein